MKVIFLGDVFGKPGRQLVYDNITILRNEYKADMVVINGENLADGKGLTEKTTKPLFDCGVDVITSGNHLWDRNDSHDFIKRENRIVKPLNYPSIAVGNPYFEIDVGLTKCYIISLSGQMFMPSCNSPFQALYDFAADHCDVITIVDFHAESTAEKRALAHMFDGKVSAIIGTHTHIQTSDEEILPQGTGYITDAGMTGPHDSVIGVKKHLILEKMLTGMPVRYEVADSGLQINGVFLDIDEMTKRTLNIERIKQMVR